MYCFRVRGDCIQCPFHNWKFSGDTGKCVDVPYSTSTIPEQARLETRTCVEMNGMIMMWHHAEGESPSWYPPEIEQVTSGDWVYQGRNEFYVNCHIEVMSINQSEIQLSSNNFFYSTGYSWEWSRCCSPWCCSLSLNNVGRWTKPGARGHHWETVKPQVGCQVEGGRGASYLQNQFAT